MLGHRIQVGARRQAALGHEGAVLGRMRDKVVCPREIDGEVAQVAVVDADQPRLQLQRAVQFGAVVDLHQHVHAAIHRRRLDLGRLRVVERGHDDQNGVGTDRPRLGRLPRIDQEILADDGQVDGGACGDQIGVGPPEPMLVGQHRQAGGTAGGIGAGVRGRIEILADHALGGARLLDLGDQREAGRGLRVQRGAKPAWLRDGGDPGVEVAQRGGGLARGDFGALGFENTVENGHR